MTAKEPRYHSCKQTRVPHCMSGPLCTGDSTESLGTPNGGAALFCFSSAGTASLHLLFHGRRPDVWCGKRRRRRRKRMYAPLPYADAPYAFRCARTKTRVGGDEGGFLPSPDAAAAVPPDTFWHENDPLCLRKRWRGSRITSIMDLH